MATKKMAMADKMKTAAKDFAAKKSADTAKPAMPARPAATVSPNAAKMVGKPLGGATTMGSRAGVTMTPRIKQGLQGMADKTREAVMQRGKPTLVSGMKKGGKAGKK